MCFGEIVASCSVNYKSVLQIHTFYLLAIIEFYARLHNKTCQAEQTILKPLVGVQVALMFRAKFKNMHVQPLYNLSCLTQQ